MRAVPCSAALILVLGLALSAPHRAGAGSWDRTGWNAGLDLGGGSAGFRDGGADDREVGLVAGIRGGYGFRSDLAAGAAFAIWSSEVEGVDWTFFMAGPSLTWYPGRGDLYVRGAFGMGNVSAFVGETDRLSDNGLGALGSIGLELHLVRTVAMNLQADYVYINAGSGTAADFVSATVGFTWYIPSRTRDPR